MVLGLTGGETVLVVMAAVFILFALAVSMLIPRSRPNFPGDRLGLFIFAVLLLFLGMMTAVVTATGGEEHGAEATHEGAASEPTGTETGPGETETGETETGETETGETETGETETGETGTGEPGETGDAAAGAEVFASAGCVSCHTLAAANATGTIGPNLDEAKPSADLVVERVTNGAGAMPSFADRLSEQQIQDVAAYVVESTSG
jgi:cytochrome c553